MRNTNNQLTSASHPEVNAFIHAQSKTIGLEPLFRGSLMLRSNNCICYRRYRQNAKRSNAPTTQAARTKNQTPIQSPDSTHASQD
ncbi:hypothetical protein ACVIIV_005957 [Bradyrhizobium sp. USDA 4354]